MAFDRRDFLKGVAATAALAASGTATARKHARHHHKSRGRHKRHAGLPTPADLCFASAAELLALMRAGELSARELMVAHLARIAQINPLVNAIVAKLPDDECLRLATAVDQRRARGETLGVLAGLPWAFKDLQPVIGFPWTQGSPIYADLRPDTESVLVERIRAAGALPIGKTNVPEFGMGSHTYNRVYGTTLNPYDLTRSAGGSSGGAGAALASGMLPLADGSDLGGSLRNPANFNNVVGFRPTVGLVPDAPSSMPLYRLSVKGPMARSVADVALLLGVLAGEDARDPGCYPSDPMQFRAVLERDLRGTRVAWCPNLGALPLDAAVADVLAGQRTVLEGLGCIVEDAAPDLRDADDIFLTLRAWRSFVELGPLLERHRDQMKPEAIAEIEAGARITAADLARVMTAHAALLERMRRFHLRYDVLAAAVNQVVPFDAHLDWPKFVAGVPMEHYIAWMQSAYWITTTCQPAISVPAGFTPDGLPVGLQLVGRRREDLRVLQVAYAFEQATAVGLRRPTIIAG